MNVRMAFGAGAGLALVLGACATLDPVAENTCGNNVIESREDCDGFGVGPGTECRKPGEVGECHLDCTNAKCPAGWGCGTDKLCRQPSGAFEAQTAVPAGADEVTVLDFDGDGRSDLLSRGVPGALRSARARFHFFDDKSTETLVVPVPLGPPHVVRMEGDAVDDVAVATLGTSVFFGNAGRKLAPLVSPSFDTGQDVRIHGAFVDPLAFATSATSAIPKNNAVLAVAAVGGTTALSITTTGLQPVEALLYDYGPGVAIDDARLLTGAPRSPLRLTPGAAGPSACGDLVTWVRGQKGVSVLPGCGTVDLKGAGGVLLAARPGVPAKIVTGVNVERVFAAHVTDDVASPATRLDLVIIPKKAPPVFAKNTGTGFDVVRGLETVGIQLPVGNLAYDVLAVGDYNGDGRPDFVTNLGVFLSRKLTGSVEYVGLSPRVGLDWAEAVVADFDGDGHPDLVARTEGQVDVDFLSGFDRGLVPSAINFQSPVKSLAIGDFDADGLADLVAVEDISTTAEAADPTTARGRVSVVFGARSGPPIDSTTVADGVAGLRQVLNIGSVSAGVGDDIDDLALLAVTRDASNTLRGLVTIGFGSSERLLLTPLVSAGGIPVDTALGHFRDKGVLDVVGVSKGQSQLSFFAAKGKGNNEFETPVTVTTDATALLEPFAFEVGDIDGTGVDAAFVAGRVEGGTRLGVARATVKKSGSTEEIGMALTQIARLEMLPGRLLALKLVDVDEDGKLDALVVVGEPEKITAAGAPGAASGGQSKAYVLFNLGGGSFEPPRELGVKGAVAVTPIRTRAGAPRDLAVASPAGIVLLRPRADKRSWDTLPLPGGPASLRRPTALVAGDFDGNGVEDLAVVDDGSIVVHLGRSK